MTRVQAEAKAILVAARRDDVALRKATRLGIGIVGSVSEALAVLEDIEVRCRVLIPLRTTSCCWCLVAGAGSLGDGALMSGRRRGADRPALAGNV